ncbi:sensor histidine kinase [Actinoplanes sp. N902-109]|uniref:sensor histidine kinase n=1 Tax=Actinoplanes sp. (strain N902-109) TaxID=649831 RepID=UPI000329674A|nr:histidine kinase [Actinoplanes sp. N902-109]AGL16352.1 two-component system sensor kinase [Actinoplanes sp. N902-109]
MRKNLGPVPVDAFLALVLTGLSMATLVAEHAPGTDLLAYGLTVLTAAPLVLRQRAPMITMTIIMVALMVYPALGYGGWPNSGVAMVIGMFTVATLRSRKAATVMYLASLAVAVVAYLTFPTPLYWSEIVQFALVMAAAWVVGGSTCRWAQRVERLAKSAGEAVTQERVRIAREMHDIVTHHMSVISLQAGLAEYVLDTDPSTARTAIATVGDASREALSEMRRLLDVLRTDHDRDQEADYRPQPGLAVLEELVARTRAAGLTVGLQVTGEFRPLAAGPDLCAYRMVQESLTNVLKHAGPARACVEVDYGALTLSITVTDDGTKNREDHLAPGSFGIRGMRERAELYGGVLTAGPCSTGGFRVMLRLPLDETDTAVREKV